MKLNYKCRVCQKALRTEKGRHLHEKRVHGYSDTGEPSDPEGLPGEAVHTCSKCGRVWTGGLTNPDGQCEPCYSEPVGVTMTTAPQSKDTMDSLDGLEDDPAGFVRLQAESRADSMGHDLGKWAARGPTSAQASCNDCGRIAVYALSPPPGGEKVCGTAVTENCA